MSAAAKVTALAVSEAFAVDASMIVADAHRRRGVAKVADLDPTSSRAVAEYLSVLDDAAFGGATPVEPKAISATDPAARYTASSNSVAAYAYSDNYLIFGVEPCEALLASPFRPRLGVRCGWSPFPKDSSYGQTTR